ncbi:MAG: 23S rRNA 5-methyluridine methyltransferase [uncultured bacterium]|nr:MAG: 23S rRNA 5-methyluridine methyltransferase [uncultured bacterium]
MAVGDVEVALIFRCLMPLKETDQALLIAFGATHKIDIYIAQNPPQPLIQLHQGGREERLTYTLPNENLVFLFHPLDFTQIHLEMNRLMVAQAMSLLAVSPNDDVLDLYCGIGNFTLPLAKRAAKVVGVEGSKEMVLRAYENAQHNHIDNVQYFAANLELPNPESPWAKNRYHKLLLDPPRVGAKDVLPLVDVWQPEQILYISCNSATLARDAGLLVHTHKYHLQKVGIMNMFPHTSHVEAMALFKRKK